MGCSGLDFMTVLRMENVLMISRRRSASICRKIEKLKSIECYNNVIWITELIAESLIVLLRCVFVVCAILICGRRQNERLNFVSCLAIRVLILGSVFTEAMVSPHRKLRISVIAPSEMTYDQPQLQLVLTTVQMAMEKVVDPVSGYLPGWEIELRHRDSNCSSTIGGLASFELHTVSGNYSKLCLLSYLYSKHNPKYEYYIFSSTSTSICNYYHNCKLNMNRFFISFWKVIL